jgi:hypothetical protein
MNKKLREDLDGLCSYIFEHEFEDFVECLCNEPLYLEEGIITEAEAEELCDCSARRVEEITDKAAENTECCHAYALAHRLWKWKENTL